MTEILDAIVIGGGPAGCAASIQLAKAGRRVLLFEKQKQAHHKVCGEFLSYETQHYLQELGIDLSSLGAVAITQMQLLQGEHRVTAQLPFAGMSLSRYRLDEALMARAVENGVMVERGRQASSLKRSKNGKWTVISDGQTYLAESVFLATGKHEMKSMPRKKSKQDDYIGFKMHWRLNPLQQRALEDQVRIILFKGGYAGLELVEDGIANLCLVITKKRFTEIGKKWDLLLAALFTEVPVLATVFSDAKACWRQPLAIFGIPYGFVYNEPLVKNKGLYRLGDQMAVIPSFSGDGLAIALHTAFHAVQMSLSEHKTDYHAREHRELSAQIRRASLLSRLTASSPGQAAVVAICRHFPGLLKRFALTTRLEYFEA